MNIIDTKTKVATQPNNSWHGFIQQLRMTDDVTIMTSPLLTGMAE